MVVHISQNYKPPWQLQIYRQMREEFSRAYYTSTFVGNAFDMLAWVKSKHRYQRRRIKNPRCWLKEEAPEIESVHAYLTDLVQCVVPQKQLQELMVSSAIVLNYRYQVCFCRH